jgi:hypothetical protein
MKKYSMKISSHVIPTSKPSPRSNETSHDTLGPLDRYDHPWEKTKKKTTNKHEFVIFLLAKNTKFRIFPERSLKPQQ